MNIEEVKKGFYIFEQTKDIIHDLCVKALNKKMFSNHIDFINYVENLIAKKKLNENLTLDIVKNALNIVENEIEMYGKDLN
jgi:hypothetical protein